MLARKFSWCSDKVKVNLFRAYCTPLYIAPLWVKVKKASLKKLQVAYNDCLRILLRKPRWCSASEMFCNARVNTFHALLRNLMYKFICRLNVSHNCHYAAFKSVSQCCTIPVTSVETLVYLPVFIYFCVFYVF